MTLRELLLERERIVATMRTLLDAGIETAEDEATYARYEADEKANELNIKRAEKLEETEKQLRKIEDVPTISTPKENPKEETDEQKRLAAFESMLRVRSGHQISEQVRATLNTTTDGEGGYTVPESYYTSVIEKLGDLSVMRQNSDVIRTTSLTKIPLGGDDPEFAIIAENGDYAVKDLSFTQLSLDAYKQGGIIKVSDELISDSFLNIQDYITKKMVRGIENKEEEYFTTGTGSSQPTGIITGSSLGKTTTGTSAVTTDEVLAFIASVKAGYRKNGKLMMNSQTELALRKIKDSNGQYLWEKSLQIGGPASFDGKPILINESMPDLGTGKKFMGFGDMSYYTIADRGNMGILRMGELYAGKGQVGYRIDKRVDAKLTLSEAYKHMKNA